MKSFLRFILFAASLFTLILLVSCQPAKPLDEIRGTVRDAEDAVSGAIVRVPTTQISTRTDSEGRFALNRLAPGESVRITAWAPGYYIGGGETFFPGEANADITLVPLPAEDAADYRWVSAFAEDGESENCQNCHASQGRIRFPSMNGGATRTAARRKTSAF